MNKFSYNPNINSQQSYPQQNDYVQQPSFMPTYQQQVPQQAIYQQPPPPLISKFENFENDDKKINWYLIAKKIVIYTILFLITSHLIVSKLICNYVPLIGDNEIMCMVVKGVLMSIVIICIQAIL